MSQYIDKSVLVSEIKRRYENNLISSHSAFKNGKIEALREVKDFINTLEVKEVVLEKELTWKDIVEIEKISNLLETEWLNSTPWDGIRDCGFYAEVLKRFKDGNRMLD